MADATVHFYHFRAQVPDHVLSDLGSRYHGRKGAGDELRSWFLANKVEVQSVPDLLFTGTQIVCANEVFPEAALADPVGDLEVWNEWRTGQRRFPYPGIYSRLRLWHQGMKTTASSSVGVLGEIFTGLLAQSFVAPLVNVRPILKWPDFIMLGKDCRYSMVESKAHIRRKRGVSNDPVTNINEKILCDGLTDAVQELNAEPTVRVWLSFTTVVDIVPLNVQLCMVELEADQAGRGAQRPRVPKAMVEGLADRILSAAAISVEQQIEPDASLVDEPLDEQGRAGLWRTVKETALDADGAIIQDAVPADQVPEVMERVRKAIRGMKRVKVVDPGLGFADTMVVRKRIAAAGELAPVRELAKDGTTLLIADLLPEELDATQKAWTPAWSNATLPWGSLQDTELWRCSSSIVAMGGKDLVRAEVRNAARETNP